MTIGKVGESGGGEGGGGGGLIGPDLCEPSRANVREELISCSFFSIYASMEGRKRQAGTT